MNHDQLSKRLAAVASYIPVGSRLADIGSDHAYLPIYLALQGKISFAIAGELNEGPFQSAQKQVRYYDLESVIEVRRGDGLQVISPQEIDVITIAGMGGALIVQILTEGQAKLEHIKRLVLQPNVGSHLIRTWYRQNGWQLKTESIVEENHKCYEVLVGERGDPEQPYQGLSVQEIEQALLMGPYLLHSKDEAFLRKWQQESQKRERILHSLQDSKEDTNQKKDLLLKELNLIRKGIS